MPPIERLVEYQMPVANWSYYYSYIAEPKTRTEVDEFVHLETLELHGKLTFPKRQFGRDLTIMIACEKTPAEGQSVAYERPVLGNMDASENVLVAYLLLPATHVNRIVSVVTSNRLMESRMVATKTYRAKGMVRSFNVFTTNSSRHMRI